jgi:epoxyqueuosine reductase QueG
VIDWQKQLGSLSHREIARLAGHGWYGRSNLLVNPRFGSRVRYTTVLTDMPLPAGKPVEGSCGECRLCVSLCPAGAIKADGFDREACHAKLKEFCKIQGIGQMICGVCIKACPGKRS